MLGACVRLAALDRSSHTTHFHVGIVCCTGVHSGHFLHVLVHAVLMQTSVSLLIAEACAATVCILRRVHGAAVHRFMRRRRSSRRRHCVATVIKVARMLFVHIGWVLGGGVGAEVVRRCCCVPCG